MLIGSGTMSLYQHRKELISQLISHGLDVSVIAPDGDEASLIQDLGCNYIQINMETRGTNPFADMKLLGDIVATIRRVKPDLVLTFYTKTNIYGGIACRITSTPYIVNITGLGSAMVSGGMKQKLVSTLYKAAVKNANLVYFQNKSNRNYFRDNHFGINAFQMLPGSGVALDRHRLLPYPADNSKIKFVFIGRVIAQKGIGEFIEAAKSIIGRHPETEFHIVGPVEGIAGPMVESIKTNPHFVVHGKVIDVRPILKEMHCTVFPSYYPEGMANVLLESAAAGRPIITTDCPGCAETVEDGVSGFIVKPRDSKSVADAMERFIALHPAEKENMGLKGRMKMEREFDRQIVIDSYLTQINSILSSLH